MRAFHDERYGAFSALLRCSFDDALGRFAYATIIVEFAGQLATIVAGAGRVVSGLTTAGDTAAIVLVIFLAVVILALFKSRFDRSGRLAVPSIPPNLDPFEITY